MKNKQIIALALCTAFSFLSASAASANSAQNHWSGVDSAGAVVTDANCPIVVESERLSFDILELPLNHLITKDYGASVTAEYTFYNPADYTVTARLEFPFGNQPDYAMWYDGYNDEYYRYDDTEKYDITVNGLAIEKTVRHTLSGFSSFSVENDLPLLVDGYKEDRFFNPELAVTKYTYEITEVDKDYGAANAAFDVSASGGIRKIYLVEQSGLHSQKNGDYRLSKWADKGDILTLYVFGEPFSEPPQWTFYENGGVEDGEEISGSTRLLSTEKMSFLEFAFQEYSEDANIIAHDWYNAMVDNLNRSTKGVEEYGIVDVWSFDITPSLMRWYEYELVLAPGERARNTVTAPIYPDIDASYAPAIFGYTYLLSPARTWADFGELEIEINTPFFLIDSEEFEKTDTGYRLSRDGLPDGELKFTLSTSETPLKEKIAFLKGSGGLSAGLLIGLAVLGLGTLALLTGGAFVLIRRFSRG